MRDNTDHPASYRQTFNCTGCCVECLRIKRAEAFINKEAVELCSSSGLLHLIAELKRECQRRYEGFSSAQRVGAPQLPRVVMVNNVKSFILPVKAIALRQIPQPN